jgi:hypothetical protein
MRFILSCLSAILFIGLSAQLSQASEKRFFTNVQGKWSGSGEVVAGKFKGTRFICNLEGVRPGRRTELLIDGDCRIGLFSQPMQASVARTNTGYAGQFMDGEAGEGMDVIGGRYAPSRLDIDIRRKDLNGVMTAQMSGENLLSLTISVHVGAQLIPVIGMSLRRVGAIADAGG